jgi:hypothetical protein
VEGGGLIDHVGIINASAAAMYKAAQTGCEAEIQMGTGRNLVKVHIVPGKAELQLADAPPVAVEAPFDQEEAGETAPLRGRLPLPGDEPGPS